MAEIDAIAVIQTSTQPTNTDVIWYLSNTASTKPSSKFSLYDHDSGIWTTIESMVTSAVSSVSGNGIYGGSGTLRTGVIVTMAGHSVKFSGGNVGIGSGAISESALLDLNAADKALLLPRLITPASVVTLPVNGMFAYDVTTNKFKGYENGAWVSFSTSSSGLESLNGLTASTQTIAVGTSGTDFAVVSAVSTHTFNLPTASAVNRGALSSADWTTFNGKLSAAITSLNGLTAASQSFAIGTAGTDFNIVFSGSTHTFNFPTASAVNRGLLSTADWSTFNGKQNALTFGDLTETTSAILTITGGTGAVIGSGVTVEVQQSSGAQDGFLSSTDWTTFNGKVSSITDGGADTSLIKTSGTATVLYRLLAGTNITLTPGADSITIDSAGGTDTNFANTNLTLAANRSHTLTGFTMALVGNQVNTFSVDGATFSVDAANNRVGIGTAAPSQLFHIAGGQSLLVGSGATSSTYGLQVHDSTGSSNTLVVRDDGRVGIGTSAPSAPFTLSTASTTLGISIMRTGSSNNRFKLYLDASEEVNYAALNASHYFLDSNISRNLLTLKHGATGGVGVNNSSPDTSTLHTKWVVKVETPGGTNKMLYLLSNDAADAGLSFDTNGASGLRGKIFVDHTNQRLNFSAFNSDLVFLTGATGTTEGMRLRQTGTVSMPAIQVGSAGLSAGDLYKDTAANILASGDYVVGMKA
jgi:hypothetical protein